VVNHERVIVEPSSRKVIRVLDWSNIGEPDPLSNHASQAPCQPRRLWAPWLACAPTGRIDANRASDPAPWCHLPPLGWPHRSL